MKKQIVLIALLFIVSKTHAALTAGETELAKTAIKLNRAAIVEKNMNLENSVDEKFWPLYNDYQLALDQSQADFDRLLTDYAANWTDATNQKATEWMNGL